MLVLAAQTEVKLNVVVVLPLKLSVQLSKTNNARFRLAVTPLRSPANKALGMIFGYVIRSLQDKMQRSY